MSVHSMSFVINLHQCWWFVKMNALFHCWTLTHTVGGPGPWCRTPLTERNLGVELFLLEVRIKPTMGVVLQNKIVDYERGVTNNLRLLMNYRCQNKNHKWEIIIVCEKMRKHPSAPQNKDHRLTMYPNSILDILAWMMDQSPQRKWDASAYL